MTHSLEKNHPVFPSSLFRSYQNTLQLVQMAYVANSFTQGLAFFASQTFAQVICYNRPVIDLAFLPSSLVDKLSRNNQETHRKISWLAPVLGITVSTLAAYKFYAMSTSFLVNGLICGAHHTAMTLFSYKFPGNLNQVFIDSTDFASLDLKHTSQINSNSEKLASIVFLISSISLTLLLHNPILANAIAYPLLSITKVAAINLMIRREINANKPDSYRSIY